MPWIRMPGVEGLVYEPPKQPQNKRKHNCADCVVCQMCSDTRCESCRRQRVACKSRQAAKHKK